MPAQSPFETKSSLLNLTSSFRPYNNQTLISNNINPSRLFTKDSVQVNSIDTNTYRLPSTMQANTLIQTQVPGRGTPEVNVLRSIGNLSISEKHENRLASDLQLKLQGEVERNNQLA